jgi:hypothetical protein
MYLGSMLFELGIAGTTMSVLALVFWLAIFFMYNRFAAYEENSLLSLLGARAQKHILDNYPNMSRDEKEHLRTNTFRGYEIVQETARLCLMNMYLHGIGGEIHDESPITVADSLEQPPRDHYDMVLTNPPFGRKSSITIYNGDGARARPRRI